MHIATPGHGGYDEDFCAESFVEGYISDSEFRQFLINKMYDVGWDGTGNYKIDQWATSGYCEGYWPDMEWIEMRISVVEDASPYYCGSASCVNFAYEVWQQSGAIKDHFQARLWLRRDHMYALTSPSATATLNHELGPAFGLYDPFDTLCIEFPYSVMHQFYEPYRCPSGVYILTPYPADKTSVVNNLMPAH